MTKEIWPYELNLKEFRCFRDVTIKLGRKITVISGQNGVGKSNILSLIASASGIHKKSSLGGKFQPEFYDFFNIDPNEPFDTYKLYVRYCENNKTHALTKRLSFKDDTADGRGIRIIPRTSGENGVGIKEAEKNAKINYGVGGAGRVLKPTIYLSISRLYPLGEKKDSVTVKTLGKQNALYQKKANEKFQEWYSAVIPNVLERQGELSVIEKGASARASLHVKMEKIPTLSQSVGQDNIGNIISALVDIYMLSQEQDYAGALICIDEVDVSLHPDTQIKLLDLLRKLADELNIQFIVSTHSLTILKEMLKKEKKQPDNYSVVYLKNPSAPYVTGVKTYEMLKADLFGSMTFKHPQLKIYFEDDIGKKVFDLLIHALELQESRLASNNATALLRNAGNESEVKELNDRVHELTMKLTVLKELNPIITHLGCEDLLKISKADPNYFKRVVILLDGDARYKDQKDSPKPRVRDYLECEVDTSGKSDRAHEKNVCFLPNYFAPESFLYRIIYRLTKYELDHMEFWRTLDQNESTALFTSSKIKGAFGGMPQDFNNDTLKGKFTEEIWRFIEASDMLGYYYCDYNTVGELLKFMEDILAACEFSYPIMLSNRYS